MENKTNRTILQELISNNLLASDFKWSLFYSAVQSQKPNLLRVPKKYLDIHNEPDFVQLLNYFDKVPSFQQIIDQSSSIDPEIEELLTWVLNNNRIFTTDNQLPSILTEKLKNKPPNEMPFKILEMTRLGNPVSEANFQAYKEEFGSGYGFHGSKLECFSSIMNYGLAQHLCKRDLYGEGIYLSTDLDLALNFSSPGPTWKHSLFPQNISCVALCEYIQHPSFVYTNNKKGVPNNYILVRNNDLVRVRHVLVYGKPRNKKQIGRSKYILTGVILYLLLLIFIGFFTSDKGHLFRQYIIDRFL